MKNCITEDKTAGFLDTIDSIVITEISDGFHITWDTASSYTSQEVQIAYRLGDNSDAFTLIDSVARDTGQADTPATLETGEEYTMWIRPESPDYYGIWQCFKNLITTI